ncbi:MAG: DUF4870 domain-containing protein [Acidobacteria bacterium]|nr:DUF4870 domain-containing protein [Acidobacteriota bacterium]MBV9477231.1 DUF4870 domain-containing protein [Acidobacteriota bacterium]
MSEIPPPTIPPATPPPPGGGSYTPPPPPPGGYTPTPGASSDRTLWLVLSYLGILSLVPFFAKKDDPEVQWHAKNGVALFGAEIVVWIVLLILGIVLRGVLSCGISALSCIVWCAFLVISIICIVKAVGGQRYRIPVITDFAEKM